MDKLKSAGRPMRRVAVAESAALAALLVFTLLPLTALAGGVVFVPWTHAYWNRRHFARVLADNGRVLGAMIGMVVLFVAQASLDPLVTAWLGWDFTAHFATFDGGVHARIQAWVPSWIAFAFAVVYLLGFPVLLYLTPIVAAWLGDPATVRRAFAVYAGLYLVALPFYFFMPVREVWAVGHAANLAVIAPGVERLLYAFNDVNNAFPSMHTAMAIGMAYVAWRGPSRAFARFAVTLAVLIPWSTIVLGIHWTLDVAAGIAVVFPVLVVVERALPARRPVREWRESEERRRENP